MGSEDVVINSWARSGREDKAFLRDVSSHFARESLSSSNFFSSYIILSFGQGKGIIIPTAVKTGPPPNNRILFKFSLNLSDTRRGWYTRLTKGTYAAF